jgi:hypothetical protein
MVNFMRFLAIFNGLNAAITPVIMLLKEECSSTGTLASFAVLFFVIGFTCVGIYICLELFIQIFTTFKRRSGTYFYSFVGSTIGTFIFAVADFLLLSCTSNPYVMSAVLLLGWIGMVTGQSLVQWSRLHLLVYDTRTLKGILMMIIVNGIVIHTSSIVLQFMVRFQLSFSAMKFAQVR